MIFVDKGGEVKNVWTLISSIGQNLTDVDVRPGRPIREITTLQLTNAVLQPQSAKKSLPSHQTDSFRPPVPSPATSAGLLLQRGSLW